MNTDMSTADYLMRFLQDENPTELFEECARPGLQELEDDATYAANDLDAQQEAFEQRIDPLVERVLQVNVAPAQKAELEELQRQSLRLQEVQDRLQQGIATKNQELEKLTAQILESRLSIQKTIEDAKKQKKAPDPRFELLNQAITSRIRESH
jgi:SMC interacting uncharacterized protein involved in chromosome segregation